MASVKRRTLNRPTAKRPYRRLCVIVAEGRLSEPAYFQHIAADVSTVHVKCLKKGDKSSPDKVLKRMQAYLVDHALIGKDEAWLVVDKDEWTDAQLDELASWAAKDEKHHLAVSNPAFEYWLLLHFEEGTGLGTKKQILAKLSRALPNYDKAIDVRKFDAASVTKAIARASARDNPPVEDWPHQGPSTTVYRLAKKIIDES